MKYKKLEEEDVKLLENIELKDDELRQFLASKGFYDKSFFCEFFLNPHGYLIQGEQLLTPNHHKEIRDYLDKKQDFNLIEPRGHGKTTAVLEWILWSICYEQEKSILYIASSDLGKQGLGKIRGELETNELLIECFGNLVPTNSDDIKDKRLKRWKQTNLELLNGCFLSTMSKGQPVRGQRPTKIIFDDPQENKDVQNKTIVEKFNNRVFSSLYNTLLPGGSMTVLGTIVGNLCLVLHLKEEKERPTLYREACDEDFNHILWPELWNKESLINRKKKIGTPLFNQEFRHIPLNKADALIQPEWINHYRPEDAPKTYDIIVGSIDPIKKASDKSDFMGISIRGVTGNKKYCIFSKGIRLSRLKAGTFIQMAHQKYHPDVRVYEINVEGTLFDLLREKGLPMEEVTSVKDKYSYLLDVEPQFEKGEIYLRAEGKDSMLERQLTNFPDVDHDDVMDSCTKALKYIEENTGGKATSI